MLSWVASRALAESGQNARPVFVGGGDDQFQAANGAAATHFCRYFRVFISRLASSVVAPPTIFSCRAELSPMRVTTT